MADTLTTTTIAAWFAERLTYEAFMRQDDDDLAADLIAWMTERGWTVRPPCVECDARHPCRLTFDVDNPGECALAAAMKGATDA